MRTPLPVLLLTAVAVTAAAAAPVSAQNREHQQIAAVLQMLQEQAQQHALALAQLADAIKAVNGSIADSNQTSLRRFADIENTLKGMATDLSAMKTRSDETNTLIRTLSEDINALRKTLVDLPDRLTRLVTPPVFPPVDSADPAATAVGVAPPPVTREPLLGPVGLTPTQMYETAFGDYAIGQWTAAISGFDQFLKVFPQSPRAGAAQFHIGESYFVQNRFEDAIKAYDAVLRNYPKDEEYVPQALYKRGLAHMRLDQSDAARASFEQVIKNYPNTNSASLAQQRLFGLPKPAPAKK